MANMVWTTIWGWFLGLDAGLQIILAVIVIMVAARLINRGLQALKV